jgi:hypothetical protein
MNFPSYEISGKMLVILCPICLRETLFKKSRKMVPTPQPDKHVFLIVQLIIVCLCFLVVAFCEWVADDNKDLPFYDSFCRTVEKALETRRRNCYYRCYH